MEPRQQALGVHALQSAGAHQNIRDDLWLRVEKFAPPRSVVSTRSFLHHQCKEDLLV